MRGTTSLLINLSYSCINFTNLQASYHKFFIMFLNNSSEVPYEPLLAKYLRIGNIRQLVRIMLNPKDSLLFLCEYENTQYEKRVMQLRKQQKILSQSYRSFDLEDIIRIKGKKNYVNDLLKKMLRYKLFEQEVSPHTRKILWLQFTGIRFNNRLYEELKKIQIDQYFENLIWMDLKRTNATKQQQKLCFNVLITFVKYNPYIGYCQGMNFIIIFLLQLKFTEQQCFFIWKYLTEEVVPLDYYTNMITMFSDKTILVQILGYHNKKVYDKIKKFDSDPTSVTFSWFICLFTKQGINKQISKIIWDFMIVQGMIAIFKAAITFFNLLEDIFLKENDFGDLLLKIQERIPKITDVKIFRTGMKEIFISNRMLELCRFTLNEKYQKDMLMNNGKKKKGKIVECNYESHICFQVIENNKVNSSPFNFFVFRKKPEVNVIKDYLDNIETKYYFSRNRNTKESDILMIGRLSHQCEASKQFEENRNSQNSTNGTEKAKSPKLNDNKFKNTTTLQKSESMAFLKLMMQNPSFHNLLQIDEQQITQ